MQLTARREIYYLVFVGILSSVAHAWPAMEQEEGDVAPPTPSAAPTEEEEEPFARTLVDADGEKYTVIREPRALGVQNGTSSDISGSGQTSSSGGSSASFDPYTYTMSGSMQLWTWQWITLAVSGCCCLFYYCLCCCGGAYYYQKNRQRRNRAWGASGGYGQDVPMTGAVDMYSPYSQAGSFNQFGQTPGSYAAVSPGVGGYGPSYY
jgi:hypothetical protein